MTWTAAQKCTLESKHFFTPLLGQTYFCLMLQKQRNFLVEFELIDVMSKREENH